MNKKANKNPSKSLKDAPLPPLPFARHIKSGEKDNKKLNTDIDNMKTDDAFRMIEHIRQATDEMYQNIEELIKKSGWSPDSKDFLDNPSNFSVEQWEKLQSKRRELNEMIGTPEKAGQRKEREPTLLDKPQGPSLGKQRRTKAAASRRKWLPMQ